jgi:predicted enzyme related to lactoylglutathione lyase
MSAHKFVWHDLMTSDVEGAKRFYGELVNWTFKKDANSPYTMAFSDGKDVAGLLPLDAKMKAPPHWIGYIAVADVDAHVKTLEKQGAKVLAPVMLLPDVGKWAVIADPQGAVFAAFQYQGKTAPKPETNEMPAPYTFCWDENLTADPDAAANFYATAFGWKVDKMDMAAFGSYWLLRRPGVKGPDGMDKSAGGVMQRPPGMPVSAWMTYLAIPDADASAEKAKRLGANVVMPPTDIPNIGRFFSAIDPQGAALGFLAPPKK